MAKIKFPSYIKEGGGRMNDAVLVTRKETSYMMTYRKREITLTDNQKAVNRAFTTMVGDWKQLSGIIIRSWNFYAKNTSASGYNLFIGGNVIRRRDGAPIELCRGMGEEPLENFTATTGNGAGEIICGFPPVEAGRHITLFLRRETEHGERSQITRHDAGANPCTPYTITGLESGAQYYIYAVVTDAQYDAALTVSRSAAALSTAE